MSRARGRRLQLDPDTLRPRGRHQRAARERGAGVTRSWWRSWRPGAGGGCRTRGDRGGLAYGSSCDLDSLRSVRIGENSFLYAADGSLLGSIPAERNREPVSAAEHVALGPQGDDRDRGPPLLRARRRRLRGDRARRGRGRARRRRSSRAGRRSRSSSSATSTSRSERTVQRKVKEACLATKLDGAWTKQRILTTYLNQVYYGNHAYGIEAAAQTYYSKPAKDADSRPVGAARRSARRRPRPTTRSRPRLGRSHGATKCSARCSRPASSRGGVYKKAVGCADSACARAGSTAEIREPYFFGYVRDKLIEAYGAETVRSGGLQVYTTIVPRYQRLAEKAIRDTLDQPSDPAAALISISPRTGAIRAMAAVIPNRPKNEFNLLSQARRQPGSTFKTFVLAAAVERESTRTRRTTSRRRSRTRCIRPATATTAAGGACTRTRTTTTGGARSGARRCARTTRSMRS